MGKKFVLLVSILLFSIAKVFADGPPVATTTKPGEPGETDSTPNIPTLLTTPDPNVPEITDSSTTTTESTTTTTTTEPPRGPCYGREGEISADEFDCSKFTVCTQTDPVVFYCPTNYIFKAGQNRCVIGSAETCEATIVESLCSSTFFGAYPHPERADRFVACLNGIPQVTSCGPGKIFEALLSRCINIS